MSEWPSYGFVKDIQGFPASEQRYKLATIAAKTPEEFRRANSSLTMTELMKEYKLSGYDVRNLRMALGLGITTPRKAKPVTTAMVVAGGMDVDGVADEIVRIAIAKLGRELDIRMKLSIANTLHEAALLMGWREDDKVGRLDTD